MQSILDAINEWIKEILIGAINGNLSTMFGDVNEKVGTIAAEVGRTPQAWNANVFSMIRALSENVIVPIAGLVITYVLCYELISMVTEKNNMHDVDTSMFFKWVFKAFVAVYLVTQDVYKRQASDNEPSDSNHGITLKEAKSNFSKFGACEKEMLCYVRPPRDDEKKIS